MKASALEFGPYRFHPGKRILERDGHPVKLNGRTTDMLAALLDRPGEIITNEELLTLVWPKTIIDPISIRVHMSLLRKALGQGAHENGFIVNVSGKGYRFVAPLNRIGGAPGQSTDRPRKAVLPGLVTTIIGRDGFNGSVIDELPFHRLITITGPGGVGKTTAALSIANGIQNRYEDGAFFVDLGYLEKHEHVATAISSALGAGMFSDDPASALFSYLADKNLLIVLDNCEHVLQTAALISERILADASDVHILATSREPLGAASEWVRRLQPLRVPGSEGRQTLTNILAFPAIDMFIQRATATRGDFLVTNDNVRTVVELCARLDGIPLAIEFAASRIQEFGLEGVAERIGDRFGLLNKGRRTALPRQRTLMQTLDWSYDLLSPVEARVVRRLSLFAAGFSIADAAALSHDEKGLSITDVVRSLVGKSILAAVSGDEDGPLYRMLEMTREYAVLKLRESGELDDISLEHAKHILNVLKKSEADWGDGVSARWTGLYGHRVPDVRRAIGWSIAHEGFVALGVELIAYSSLLFTSLGLIEEHRADLQRGIEANSHQADPDHLMAARMYSALGNVLYQMYGHLDDDRPRDAFVAAVEASRKAGDTALELRSLSGLSASYLVRGRNLDAVALSDEIISRGGEGNHVVHRTLAHSNFYAGRFEQAKFHLDATLMGEATGRNIQNSGAQFDLRLVTIRGTLSQYLYVTGKVDSAMAVVNECLENPEIHNYPIPLCHILAGSACSIAFNLGGRSEAQRYLDLLRSTATNHSMGMWMQWPDEYEALMVPRTERKGTSEERYLRRLAVNEVRGSRLYFYAVLGDRFVEPWMIDRALLGSPGWYDPEIMRAKGELDFQANGDAAAAENVFMRALDYSRENGTATWELRAAMSLARLELSNGTKGGRDALNAALDKFTEGHRSVDVLEAKVLLAAF